MTSCLAVASSPTKSLAGTALDHIEATLAQQRSSLTGQGLEAITALLATLEKGLSGKLSDDFYLSSIDPGMGKTLSVSMFIKAWKEQGFQPPSSVLIAVSRIDQIKPLIDQIGLTANQVAVVTSDPSTDPLGVPKCDRASAPVLITTHSMVRSRTKQGTFADAGGLSYLGGPRALRIWDETILPAVGVALRLDEISALPQGYRAAHPEFIKAVQGLLAGLLTVEVGARLTVPEELEKLIPHFTKDGRLGRLRVLCGRDVQVVDGGNQGPAIMGVGRSLPADLAPMVILDASGRVRHTYQLWEKHRGGLVRLPSAVNDYRNLELHLWQRGSGKISLGNPNARGEIVNAVAEVINRDPVSRWLVVHQKDRHDLAQALIDNVEHDGVGRISPLTWGQHDATNAFKDITNVVVVGQINYGDLGFQAVACAAAGVPLIEREAIDAVDFQWSEFQHNLLQALSRASVRKSSSGIAGACRAYVIATPSPHTVDRVAATFPGCSISTWKPVVKPMTKHVAAAAAYLQERFSGNDVREVRKADLTSYLGIKPPNLNRILSDEQFQGFLEELYIIPEAQKFKSLRPIFKPRDMD